MTRSLALVASLVFCACGVLPPDACSPDSCAGCCDAKGACQTGQTVEGCGSGGRLCVVCSGSEQCDQALCRAPVCVPQTCGARCGEVDDGCGGTLACGGCPSGESCGGGGPNLCGTAPCTPTSCPAQGCGRMSDGCAALLDCGTCASGVCGGGGPNVCGTCLPKTCAALAKNCGPVADGCGGTVACGTCSGPNVCGGGGVANVCGLGACVPKSCAQLGKNCGVVPDGCGTMLSCGSCSGFLTCGGAGTANVCGASCTVTCPSGFTCTGGVCAGGSLTGLVLDEVGVAVSGRVTVNGAMPSRNGFCAIAGNATREVASVLFTEATRSAEARVSILCSTPDFGFSTMLPPGTWSVRVRRGSSADEAGVNLLPVEAIVNAQLVVTGPVSNLILNEVGHAVSGKVTVQGGLPTRNGFCAIAGNATREIARVTLEDAPKGHFASVPILCSTTDFGFAVQLPTGTYAVRVHRGSWADESGVNLMPVAYLGQAQLAVTGPVANVVLDEVGHAVNGKITVNGALPTRNGFCAIAGNAAREVARVQFSESAKGYWASVSIPCSTTDFGFSTVLPAGTYAVRVEPGSSAPESGVNLLPLGFLAQPQLAITGPVPSLVLNEVGHPVSGKVTVHGALPVRNGFCAVAGNAAREIARVTFMDSAKGYYAPVPILCSTTDFGVTQLLAPGTYEVRVERASWADESGVNLLPLSHLATKALVVNGPVSGLVWNEVGVAVSGKVTVNGALPTRNGFCAVAGNATREVARLQFFDRVAGATATVSIPCSTVDFGFSTSLPPATYDVRVQPGGYASESGVNLLPVSYVARTQVVVSGPTSNLVVDEVGRAVSGKVTVNGAVPSRNGFCAVAGNATREIARIGFTDSALGHYATLSVPCASTDVGFTTQLPKGTYDVTVQRGSWAGEAGMNLLPLEFLAIQRLAVP